MKIMIIDTITLKVSEIYLNFVDSLKTVPQRMFLANIICFAYIIYQ